MVDRRRCCDVRLVKFDRWQPCQYEQQQQGAEADPNTACHRPLAQAALGIATWRGEDLLEQIDGALLQFGRCVCQRFPSCCCQCSTRRCSGVSRARISQAARDRSGFSSVQAPGSQPHGGQHQQPGQDRRPGAAYLSARSAIGDHQHAGSDTGSGDWYAPDQTKTIEVAIEQAASWNAHELAGSAWGPVSMLASTLLMVRFVWITARTESHPNLVTLAALPGAMVAYC